MSPVVPLRHEPPAALASMASFGLVLTEREVCELGDWCCELVLFVERIAALDPSLGLLDGTAMVADAKALIDSGLAEPDGADLDTVRHG